MAWIGRLGHVQEQLAPLRVEHELRVERQISARGERVLERALIAPAHERDDPEPGRDDAERERPEPGDVEARGEEREHEASHAVGSGFDDRLEQRAHAGLLVRGEGHVERLERGLVHGVLQAVVGRLHHARDAEHRPAQERRAREPEDGRHHAHAHADPEATQEPRRHDDLEDEGADADDGVEEREEAREIVAGVGRARDGLELVVADGERDEGQQDHEREAARVGVLRDGRRRAARDAAPRPLGVRLAAERERGERHEHHERDEHEEQLRGADELDDRACARADQDHAEHTRRADHAEEALGGARVEELVGARPELHEEEVRDDLRPDVEDRQDPDELGAHEHPGAEVARGAERHRGDEHAVARQPVGVARVDRRDDRARGAVGDEHPGQRAHREDRQEERVAHRATEDEDRRGGEQLREQQRGAARLARADEQGRLEATLRGLEQGCGDHRGAELGA